MAIDQAQDRKGVMIILWQCAKRHLDYPCGSTTHRFHKDRDAIPALLLGIRWKSIEDTDLYRRHKAIGKELGESADFAGLTPANKVAVLSAAGIGPSRLSEFLSLGAGINVLMGVKSSLPAARSGISSYMRCFTLLGRPDSPTTQEAVERWGATFNPGKTFNQYMAHLQKASILLNQPLTWLTPNVRDMGKGMGNAQDMSFKFQSFVRSMELFILLGRTEIETEIGHAFFLSYLFALRVPSETLALMRAFRDDPITEFTPQKDKALIATRPYKTAAVLPYGKISGTDVSS